MEYKNRGKNKEENHRHKLSSQIELKHSSLLLHTPPLGFFGKHELLPESQYSVGGQPVTEHPQLTLIAACMLIHRGLVGLVGHPDDWYLLCSQSHDLSNNPICFHFKYSCNVFRTSQRDAFIIENIMNPIIKFKSVSPDVCKMDL